MCSKVVMLVEFVIFDNCRSGAPNEVKFLWHATNVIVDVWKKFHEYWMKYE